MDEQQIDRREFIGHGAPVLALLAGLPTAPTSQQPPLKVRWHPGDNCWSLLIGGPEDNPQGAAIIGCLFPHMPWGTPYNPESVGEWDFRMGEWTNFRVLGLRAAKQQAERLALATLEKCLIELRKTVQHG
jgi:hypothetical protein